MTHSPSSPRSLSSASSRPCSFSAWPPALPRPHPSKPLSLPPSDVAAISLRDAGARVNLATLGLRPPHHRPRPRFVSDPAKALTLRAKAPARLTVNAKADHLRFLQTSCPASPLPTGRPGATPPAPRATACPTASPSADYVVHYADDATSLSTFAMANPSAPPSATGGTPPTASSTTFLLLPSLGAHRSPRTPFATPPSMPSNGPTRGPASRSSPSNSGPRPASATARSSSLPPVPSQIRLPPRQDLLRRSRRR